MSLRLLPVRSFARRGAPAIRRSNRAIFGNSREAVTNNSGEPFPPNAERTPCRDHGFNKRFYATRQQDSNDASNHSEKIGLFSIKGLVYPSDFQRLTKQAIQESDGLRDSIPSSINSKSHARDVLYQLDQISRTVCNVIDAAELCRSAGPFALKAL